MLDLVVVDNNDVSIKHNIAAGMSDSIDALSEAGVATDGNAIVIIVDSHGKLA